MGDEASGGVGEMHKRRVTLEDGRYLIYYTFGDEAGEARSSGGGEARREAGVVGSKRAAEAGPGAGEESGV